MEGIPAPDVADYKRRKEIELGLAAGSISQPPAKRPKTENRPMSEEELKAALEAHKALMGAGNTEPALGPSGFQFRWCLRCATSGICRGSHCRPSRTASWDASRCPSIPARPPACCQVNHHFHRRSQCPASLRGEYMFVHVLP